VRLEQGMVRGQIEEEGTCSLAFVRLEHEMVEGQTYWLDTVRIEYAVGKGRSVTSLP
jgi:hypothetical protein